MISLQHACLSSVLACAAATTLPPSPAESIAECSMPVHPADIALPESPVTPATPTESWTCEKPGPDPVESRQPSPEPTPRASDPPASSADQQHPDPDPEPSTKPSQDEQASCTRAQTPEAPSVSFAQFARQLQLEKHQRLRKRTLLHRLRHLRTSVSVSVRLLRACSTVQKGLVENFKQCDKSSFISTFNSILDMREACDAAWRRNIQQHDPLISTSLESGRQSSSSSFVQRLTQRSREDLLEILTLARTDSQFLFRCIAPLIPTQVSALISPVHSLDVHDSGFGTPRVRTQPLFSKRTTAHSLTFKEYVFALERTDPLYALIFNLFADPLDADTAEARLRLDVWSSTCTKLISYGGSSSFDFVGHLLSCWAGAREWKAKHKFEIYLMDVLQDGAFLLEQHDLRHLGMAGHLFDPLQTDVADKFFQSAVSTLFEVLDDPDGGLPAGALQLGNAILGELTVPEVRRRFTDYIFFQWFFCKFLHNALCYPESLGLLLDFHISKDARDRLLAQIALRAQAQLSRVLHAMPPYSLANPSIKTHVESMLSQLNPETSMSPNPVENTTGAPAQGPADHTSADGNLLLLSATDITTILDVLFPRTASSFSSPQSYQNPSTMSPNPSYYQSTESSPRIPQPGFFQGRIDTLSSGSSSSKTVFTTEMSFQDATGSCTSSSIYSRSPVSPQRSVTRNADRIRFEILEISEADDRPTMEHPANEDWAMFHVSRDTLNYHSTDDEASRYRETLYNGFSDGPRNEVPDMLQSAVLKLAQEFSSASEDVGSIFRREEAQLSLENDQDSCLVDRFTDMMEDCQHQYDPVQAHYWWNASRLLKGRYPSLSPAEADSRLLFPMFDSMQTSTEAHTKIIRHCEKSFVGLKRTGERLQKSISERLSTLQKLRNKMWYMTDVKNSLRYEDARNVALALKKMTVSQSASTASEQKPKQGGRTLGGSFLQKPEIQVMNVMKAPGNQGGPSKLSDEQVEVTRKWLERSGIDNFCKGEERIHRFCYEVKLSVNKLVGETMYDSPVLWSSELYQKERSLYESSGPRPVSGMSLGTNVRPSSIASEDSLYYPSQPFGQRGYDHLIRPMTDLHSLGRKSSYTSLASERWKSGREIQTPDTSSIGDSPGRTVSTSTGDMHQPFWSPPHTQPQSMTSTSSVQSRPASTFGELLTPRRTERKDHGKAAFLDELRRTVTSLLLSDLGSPVWSCGSETDAWFLTYLNDECIKEQSRKRARTRRVLADLDVNAPNSSRQLRRSRSVDSALARGAGANSAIPRTAESPGPSVEREAPSFSYDTALQRLMEKFSRPANPYTKLKALQDIRSLAIASLGTSNSRQCACSAQRDLSTWEPERQQRNSVSGGSQLPKQSGSSTLRSTVSMSTEYSPSSSPTEDQIIRALRDLIEKLQPKTLFRDLQYIAAFVPSEILNKTESGTAFLHFGLAAFALKDEVCNSIVEIADRIVSRELNTRQRRQTMFNLSPLVGGSIKDAARLWTIPALEGYPVAQRELAILYLTDPEQVPCVTLPLTMPRDTFKTEMMYRRAGDSKSDPQSMCLALHWMKLAAAGGDKLAQNRLREREEFESIA